MANPTNTDLHNELKQMRKDFSDFRGREFKEVHTIVMRHEGRIAAIDKRHDIIDAGKEAIEQFKRQEREAKLTDSKVSAWTKLTILISGLTVLAYAAAEWLKK